MHNFVVTRRISIDAAHRVSTHGSKCRNLHGHRYDIETTCRALTGALHLSGEQTDMVVDFSFLKEEMIRHIEETCDHGLIACIDDVALLETFCPEGRDFAEWIAPLRRAVAENGNVFTVEAKMDTKLYIVGCQPTAERLAEHWFHCLEDAVSARSDGQAELIRVRVWETPNCYADFEKSSAA
jgi:6-pyruvoyltetrahydropterin/6-carboxytetrahydropterin synthase